MADKWFVRGIDQSLADQVRDRAKETGKTQGQIVNSALRYYFRFQGVVVTDKEGSSHDGYGREEGGGAAGYHPFNEPYSRTEITRLAHSVSDCLTRLQQVEEWRKTVADKPTEQAGDKRVFARLSMLEAMVGELNVRLNKIEDKQGPGTQSRGEGHPLLWTSRHDDTLRRIAEEGGNPRQAAEELDRPISQVRLHWQRLELKNNAVRER